MAATYSLASRLHELLGLHYKGFDMVSSFDSTVTSGYDGANAAHDGCTLGGAGESKALHWVQAQDWLHLYDSPNNTTQTLAQRGQQWGNTYKVIGDLAGDVLDMPMSPQQFCAFMILLKLRRACESGYKDPDCFVDIMGYANLALSCYNESSAPKVTD